MAQLYTLGHDLDFTTLFTRAVDPGDYADIPATQFTRKPHWLAAQFSADGSGILPGTHVAMPDGRHVWEYAAQGATDLATLVKAAAVQVLPDASVAASEQRAVPGEGARLVTTLTRHPGGASVQVHARIDESFTLVYDAIVTRSGVTTTLPAAVSFTGPATPKILRAYSSVPATSSTPSIQKPASPSPRSARPVAPCSPPGPQPRARSSATCS
jgi:polyketide synthase 13